MWWKAERLWKSNCFLLKKKTTQQPQDASCFISSYGIWLVVHNRKCPLNDTLVLLLLLLVHQPVTEKCPLQVISVFVILYFGIFFMVHDSPIPGEHCCFSLTYLGPLVNKLAFKQYKCHPQWEPCRWKTAQVHLQWVKTCLYTVCVKIHMQMDTITELKLIH